MDRGTWWATVHGVAKESDTTEGTQHAHTPAHKTSESLARDQNSWSWATWHHQGYFLWSSIWIVMLSMGKNGIAALLNLGVIRHILLDLYWKLRKIVGSSMAVNRMSLGLMFTFMNWKRKWQPTPVFLPGKYHGQRNLVGYSPWSCKRVRHNLGTKQQEWLPRIGTKSQKQWEEAAVRRAENWESANWI